MEEFGVSRFSGAICLLFIVCMISSPLLISVDADFELAETATIFSGELLPDPYLTEEPYVEIGRFSPEFGYGFTPGSVTLIWTHTAGYELDYGGYYPSYCLEYARVLQTFEADYNESIKSIKISAALSLDCAGDFAAEDFPDNMWEINFGVYSGGVGPVRTVSDFKNGDAEEIEFMMSELETDSAFYGPEVLREIGLSVQLIPTENFGQTIGNTTPWMNYSGSIMLTITHMSFEVMVDGEDYAPAYTEPMYNMTLFSNETQSLISGIESAGYNQLYQFRIEEQYVWSGYEINYSVFTMYSNHDPVRNRSMYTSGPDSYYGIYNIAVRDEQIAFLTMISNESELVTYVQCFDSFGNSFWNSTVSLYFQDIPLAATFDESGNLLIYMVAISELYGGDPYDYELLYSLVKLDNQGNKLWNITIYTQSYSEYIANLESLFIPTGYGCIGNDIYLGIDDGISKINQNGEPIWRTKLSHYAMCVDPQGGLYTFNRIHDARSELTRWDTNGNIVWTRSLGWDYGSGWIEYPYLRTMIVEPNGPLHLVLEYNSVHTCEVLTRVSRAGDTLSQNTIFECDNLDYPLYYNLPYINDIAITGDELVHIVGTYNYPGYTPRIIYQIPGSFMVSYELPDIVIKVSPLSITMIGVSSVLLLGIAYDFFFRREKGAPEPPAEPSISDFEW